MNSANIAARPAPELPARKARVLVVDDHPIVRQGLSLLIDQQPDLAICGGAKDLPAALEAIATLNPDIIILDISLEGPDGIEVLKNVRLTHPKVPVLILSMHDESVYAERALRAGANGYIMKQEATDKVLEAVRRLLRGEIYISSRIASKILQQVVGGAPTLGQSPIDALTDRELEVFTLIGRGEGTRQIAEKLRLSVKTIESYQAHIKEKLSLRNGHELLQHAVQWANSHSNG